MRRLLITLAPLVLLIACGPGEVGEACQGGAAQNDCVDGALCTLERSTEVAPPDQPNNERFTCRQLCDSNSECEAGYLCRRAEGTMFDTCQPDPDAEPPPSME